MTVGRPHTLDNASFEAAWRSLTQYDTRLAAIVDAHGPPPFWTREPGFATLIHVILEQQVSLASALAAYRRLCKLAAPLTPTAFLELTDEQLLTAGFSRQKTSYGRGLAQALVEKELVLETLDRLPDDEVRIRLMRVKGIGPWTADVYLLMALRRSDSWPVGDLALVAAVQETLDLPSRPNAEEMEALSHPWKPWRAVAARILWHHYLSTDRTRT